MGNKDEAKDSTHTPVTQCDPGVSHCVTDENLTEAAYKHYSTNFKREVYNLKQDNGDRNTVCQRLNDALGGMIYHATAISEKTRQSEFLYLDNFVRNMHQELQNQYTQDIYNNPLELYKNNMETLYKVLQLSVIA